MCFIVDLDQLFHRDVCVDLRRRKTCMAQQFLDVAQVGAAVEQVRGKAVPQAMRRNVVDIRA